MSFRFWMASSRIRDSSVSNDSRNVSDASHSRSASVVLTVPDSLRRATAHVTTEAASAAMTLPIAGMATFKNHSTT